MKIKLLKKTSCYHILKSLIVVFSIILSQNSFADPAPVFVRNNVDGTQTLLGNVPKVVKDGTARLLFHSPGERIAVSIVPQLQNQDTLKKLLKEIYDPNSPNYHHYLTPDQFTRQFSPLASDMIQIKTFLGQQGFQVIKQLPNGILEVSAPVSKVEQAFQIHAINNYINIDGTTFYAPDTEPTAPASLFNKIAAIGADNFVRFKPLLNQVPLNYLQSSASGCIAPPSGNLTPGKVKTAYNMNSMPSNGSGQSIALFELDGYSSSDINCYEKQFKLPNVHLQNVLIDNYSGQPSGNGGNYEVTADIELLTAFAPGSSNIFVYESPPTIQGWMDEWEQIATDNKAKVVSCSWGGVENYSVATQFDNMIFQQMAAQGQSVFVASGDSGAYEGAECYVPDPYTIVTCTNILHLFVSKPYLNVGEPADQPYVTSVGISVLKTNSKNGAYISEAASLYGGGGISQVWPIPQYQLPLALSASPSAMISTTMRNVPDVSLSADISTMYSLFIEGKWNAVFGSSLSSPIWAAFMSSVNQGLGQNGPVGFANPFLYQIAQSSSYNNDFHDISEGANNFFVTTTPVYYPAEHGFDDATGLGSFNGLNLYNDLLKIAKTGSLPSAPTGLSAKSGNAQVGLSWNFDSKAFYYNVKRSKVSGGPYTTIASHFLNTFYNDYNVVNGATYYYVVSAVNAIGEGGNSSQVQATPTLLAAPTNISALYGYDDVILTWTKSPGAVSYNISRSFGSNGPYAVLQKGVVGNAFNDLSAQVGPNYYYIVAAVNSSGGISSSAGVEAVPAVPTGLKAVGGNNQVTLTWNLTPANGAVAYEVYKSSGSNGSYNSVCSSKSTICVDTSISNGKIVNYVVQTNLGPNWNDPYSAPVEGGAVASAPIAPAGLLAKRNGAQVVLSWKKSATALSYNISRYPIFNIYSSSQTVSPISLMNGIKNLTYTDKSAQKGLAYYYIVTAVNASGQSTSLLQVNA